MAHLKYNTTLVTNYGYSPAGYVQTVTDPRRIVTETTYHMLGQVIQTIESINPDFELKKFRLEPLRSLD